MERNPGPGARRVLCCAETSVDTAACRTSDIVQSTSHPRHRYGSATADVFCTWLTANVAHSAPWLQLQQRGMCHQPRRTASVCILCNTPPLLCRGRVSTYLPGHLSWVGDCGQQLTSRNMWRGVREDFTITEKAPHWDADAKVVRNGGLISQFENMRYFVFKEEIYLRRQGISKFSLKLSMLLNPII